MSIHNMVGLSHLQLPFYKILVSTYTESGCGQDLANSFIVMVNAIFLNFGWN